MGLQKYREIRDFSRTPEPRGRLPGRRKGSLRFYVQRHAARRLHYDFRLELDGVLKSWAVPKGPSLDPSERRLAVQTEDHPLDYGEFEGVIPEKQYGAGDVLLWDRGEWTPEDPDPREALRRGRLHFALEGQKLHGRWVLAKTKGDWLLIKRRDDEARPDFDVTAERPESVKRPPKRAKRAAKAALPRFVTPQLATLLAAPPASGKWLYEVKHDGYRMLARIDPDGVRLYTRSGKDWTAKLPHLRESVEALKLENTWLDGEIVVLGPEGRASFQRLQNAFEAGADAQIVYYVFDAPFLDGKDLTRLPLAERKERLRNALKPSASVRFSEHLEGEAKDILGEACKLGLEGLIGKQADAVYTAGRTRTWIKLKCRSRQDFVIGGYTPPKGSRSGFGALLVGTYDAKGKLRFAGKVGSGFDEPLLKTLLQRFAPLKRAEAPFESPPRERAVQWLRPSLVCEVAYAEKTDDGILRQASFVGLREDIAAKQVGEEKPLPQLVITHPERLVWPSLGIRKIDLVHYLEAVGEWFLPHLASRPLTLVRCPDGAEAKCFYQRHLGMGASPGELKQFRRERSSKGYYLYLDSIAGILSAAQNGAVEFHTWGARVPDVRHPDRITMDLDPGPGIAWHELVEATRWTRTLLEKLGLECFLKTTGGKGLHVVVPIAPAREWDEVKQFTREIAEFLVRARPDLFVAKMTKSRRHKRIFVDYLRNAETASAIAAFSPRARPGAGVSTPLSWDELGTKDLREKFTVKTVPARLRRLREDPWKTYAATKQSITAAMRKSLR
ncbi:MAG TPA: DNA ligase D [Burkholderiales bacterium]|nr:DNA ligase D [Burkholderiales bacterium]